MPVRFRMLVLVGVAVVLAASAVIVWRSSSRDTELTDAASACEPDNDTVSASDDGDALTVRGDGAEDAVLTTEASACVLSQLEVPDEVQSAIRTAAADGESRVQNFDQYEISWTRSKARGLELVVKQG